MFDSASVLPRAAAGGHGVSVHRHPTVSDWVAAKADRLIAAGADPATVRRIQRRAATHRQLGIAWGLSDDGGPGDLTGRDWCADESIRPVALDSLRTALAEVDKRRTELDRLTAAPPPEPPDDPTTVVLTRCHPALAGPAPGQEGTV